VTSATGIDVLGDVLGDSPTGASPTGASVVATDEEAPSAGSVEDVAFSEHPAPTQLRPKATTIAAADRHTERACPPAIEEAYGR